ncbi:unnamed protein product [Rotaria sp. Silwood1]|nr:unnamed protein product [Rotaria sp. Silwood1]
MTFNATSETSLSSSCVGSLLESKDIFQLSRHGLKISKTNLIPAICFYNGSFAPFHAGHLNVLQEAKQYIDNLGTHEFIGAYISPSHSGYAARKLDPEERIGTGHRLAMIQLAIKNFDWIMIDLFETFQSHQTSLYVILKTFISRVRSQLFHDAERIDIFWLKGEDALRYSLSDKFLQLGCHSVYILNRGLNEAVTTSNNASTIVQNCYQKRWEEMRRLSSFPERFHLIQAKNLNLSSTAIRTCAQSSSVTYEQLQSFTQLDSITSYILQHHLWGAQANVSSLIVSSLTVCPRDITELTSEILSQMLCSLSTRSIKVTSFMSKRIGIGRGWGGPLYHLYNIQYLPVVTDISLPNDMVLKLSTGIWNGIAASIEAEFYVKLAPHLQRQAINMWTVSIRVATINNILESDEQKIARFENN